MVLGEWREPGFAQQTPAMSSAIRFISLFAEFDVDINQQSGPQYWLTSEALKI